MRAYNRKFFWKLTDHPHENNYWEKAGEVRAVHPHGNSLKAVTHFIQCYLRQGDKGYFSKFDYGEQENMVRYGQRSPPSYNLDQINTKIIIYYGTCDKYIKDENIDMLQDRLKNSEVKICRMEGWGHVTYAYGRYMKEFFTNVFHDSINI